MSNSIEPLYISTGQPADGENKFFPRDKIVNQIWRKLKRGEDLLLTAPRRVGKSSILHHIEKNPRDGYIVKYLSIYGTDNSNLYFKRIYNTLLENDEIFGYANGYFEKAKINIKNLGRKIKGFNLLEVGLELDSNEKIDYCFETMELLKTLPKEAPRVIFLLDEFPETVSNIAKYSEVEAIKFLQDNRDLRQLNHDADIQFIITGSIGLTNVVEKLTNDTNLINDLLPPIHIPFLDNDEASLMIDRLCLGIEEEGVSFSLSDDSKAYLLKKIVQNSPYYIMLIMDVLSEEVIDNAKELNNKLIDNVIEDIIKVRANDYFNNWKTRLGDAFEKKEELLAIKILTHISIHEKMNYAEMKKIDKEIDLKSIIIVLEHDGYISKKDGFYSFNSPLLKEWWVNRFAE